MSTNYNVGDQSKLDARFYSSGNILSDPSTITLKVKAPNGSISTYTYGGGTVTREGVGIYSKVIDLTEAGTWTFQWLSTGLVAVEEGRFIVRANVIT